MLVAAVCLSVSLCFVVHLWLARRGDPVIGRGVWTVILLVPLLGWLFYLAFYRAPGRTHGGHAEHGYAASGGDYAGGGPPGQL